MSAPCDGQALEAVDAPSPAPTLSPPRTGGGGEDRSRMGRKETESDRHQRGFEPLTSSPRGSQQSTETIEGEDSARQVILADASEGAAARSTPDDDDDEFHDIALDANVKIVTKSIFKEKKSFLMRLKDASSSVKSKYVPGDASANAVLPAGMPTPPLNDEHPGGFTQAEADMIFEATNPETASVEVVLEEEEPIHVEIDQVAPHSQEIGRPLTERELVREDQVRRIVNTLTTEEDEDADSMTPQVVIHTTESDSDSTGFATLNPIINKTNRGKRMSMSAIPSVSPSSTNLPVLSNLPIAEEASETSERMVLIINALGATGLTKVEKFGTQSNLLEMRLCDSTEELASGATHASFLRTVLHKKGGSEAQWNQRFTTAIRSKAKQLLHCVVRTHSKMVVGETRISLREVESTLYDRHFNIHKLAADGCREDAGQIHLQLQIVDAAPLAPTSPSSRANREGKTGTIPVALRHGALMFKVPYHSHSLLGPGTTKRQWVSVTGDGMKEDICITWCDPIDTTEKSRRLGISMVTEIRSGASTKAFERLLQSEPSSVARENDRCFSVISKARTLDLVAASKEEAYVWIQGLKDLVSPYESVDSLTHISASKMIMDKSASLLSHDPPTKQNLAQWRVVIFDDARQGNLHAVCSYLHDGCPIDLLEAGTGDTLLMLACRLGNEELVEVCLSWRAKNDPHPEFGETALQVAVNAGHSGCVGLILDTAAKSEMDSEIVNHIDSNNDAPLHVAARKGDLECLQLLLHHGADVCVVEEFGRTPLHCAVLSGDLSCVAYLLDVGGDSVLNAGDHDGDTSLHYAALSGKDDVVKLLLESAADVHSTNVHGETAMDLAARENNQNCVKLISKYHHSTQCVSPTPATRNETASSLLLTQQKRLEEEFNEGTVRMDDADEEYLDDSEFESYIEPSNSPVRRGPIRQELDDICGDRNYYQVRRDVSHHPISPSARVREVLANRRNHGSLSRTVPVPHFQFLSARDDFHSRQMFRAPVEIPARHAMTERIDRDHAQYGPYTQHWDEYSLGPHSYIRSQGARRPPVHVREAYFSTRSNDHLPRHDSVDVSQYDQYGGHSCSFPVQVAPLQTPMYARRSNTSGVVQTGSGWVPSVDHQQAAHQVMHQRCTSTTNTDTVDVWETYYTDEGYPYYINRRTGTSQWENPYELSSVKPVGSRDVDVSNLRCDTNPPVSADTMVRMRIAQARQRAMSSTCTDKTIATMGGFIDIQLTQADDGASCDTDPPSPVPSTTSSGLGTPCGSPTSSKYEARTGLKLCVDVTSPPRQDETRPVYVPSPRAMSPWKGESNGNSSFEKSTRPSSPRGKSKSVQLIELKRANNLAMALSSFKINDRNEQIVHAILSLDDKVVNAELLVCLQRFFPSDEEAESLRGYDGSMKNLGTAECFFFQLLQVPDIEQRIQCFLFKLQFARYYRNAHSKIQIVKRACRDLVENYSFVETLNEFFESRKSKSLLVFQRCIDSFKSESLSHIDEKIRSFHEDLRRAAEIELLDVQLQLNSLISGARSVQTFLDKTSPPKDQDLAAHETLERFMAEIRGKIIELESDFEALGQWEDRVLALFGESKATCQLSSILASVCAVLEEEF